MLGNLHTYSPFSLAYHANILFPPLSLKPWIRQSFCCLGSIHKWHRILGQVRGSKGAKKRVSKIHLKRFVNKLNQKKAKKLSGVNCGCSLNAFFSDNACLTFVLKKWTLSFVAFHFFICFFGEFPNWILAVIQLAAIKNIPQYFFIYIKLVKLSNHCVVNTLIT